MSTVDVGVTGPVEGWFEMGEAWLDDRYGAGFARANPALLAAYVQASAIGAATEALADALDAAAVAVGRLE